MADIVRGMADDIHTVLEHLSKATEAVVIADTLQEKKAAEVIARPIVREARNKISLLRAELRRTQDAVTRMQYEGVCQDAHEKIRALDAEMRQQIYPNHPTQRVKTYAERREEELMGAGGVNGQGFQDSHQVLQVAANMQKDTLLSLERAERIQHTTEEVGHETLVKLQRQMEEMYHVDEELENMGGQLHRATRDVRRFYLQLAGDRCFLFLFGIFVLALAVFVFVLIYKGRHS